MRQPVDIDAVFAKLKRGESITPEEAYAYSTFYVNGARENMARQLESMAKQLRYDASIDAQNIIRFVR